MKIGMDTNILENSKDIVSISLTTIILRLFCCILLAKEAIHE